MLIAVGRRPHTETLGLGNAGIELSERGFVEVDAQRRTAAAHVCAIGDVAGEPMLAHKAYYEANVAAEAAAGKQASRQSTSPGPSLRSCSRTLKSPGAA